MSKPFTPPRKILWDTWFLQADDVWHMFFLQAPKRLKTRPEARHHYASIGRATSHDLKQWKYQGTVLKAGKRTQWDDLCLWTGSVFPHNEKYYLFYTGRNRAEYWQQDIGIAVSHNLSVWSKVAGDPILSADGTIYCSNWDRDERKVPPAFRDPFVCFDKGSGDFLMLFCARAKGEDGLFNGCIGLARSKDLVNWTMNEPILAPGRYAEMEVPQLLEHGGRWYLFFSTKAENYSPEWAAEVGTHNGLHVYSAATWDGTYERVGHSGSIQFAEESVYNARVMKEMNGELTALGWVEYGYHGWFQGSLSQRYQLSLTPSSSKVQPL